jgi:hypothetical protein
MNVKEAREKRGKEIRNAARITIVMSMVALHENGHTDAVWWLAMIIATLGMIAMIATWAEPWVMRGLGKAHRHLRIKDARMEESPWYRGEAE